MTLLLGLLYAAWCGVLWRVRGGAWETLLGLPPGTTRARLACAGAMALPLLVVTPWWDCIAVAAALYLGMALAGWGGAMDIGRVSGDRWGDTLEMSMWGLFAMMPIAIVVAGVAGRAGMPLVGAWLLMPLVGPLFGPIYALAWHVPRLPDVPRFAGGPTEWAEVACGAVLGLALWAALP